VDEEDGVFVCLACLGRGDIALPGPGSGRIEGTGVHSSVVDWSA
jgi:hypothetical protein